MAKRPQPVKTVGKRCAIYTRKSTEEGLEQEFNSLDAQREACAAYILSQKHEGWSLVRDSYDDGGFSGGTMERPGLKRLLADVALGKVDVIVVYKVDRLTRALSDFAKIVEVLDARGASFVSITQAFNTTTSMGRLTLNVLLSFAQFEREVTGERIRDKIAASKKKGMWMGGNPPLGLDVRERKLVINDAEAETVRHIFRRYLALGSGPALVEELRRTGYRTRLAHGRGGIAFHNGALYHLLRNRMYIGKIVHRGIAYDGEHEPIIPLELWERTQALLTSQRQEGSSRPRSTERSLLIGRVRDGNDRAMTPSHAVKGSRRYRYYVTHARELDSDGPPAARIAAHDLESLVIGRIADLLASRSRVADLLGSVDAGRLGCAYELASRLGARLQLPREKQLVIEAVVSRVRLAGDRIAIDIRRSGMRSLLGLDTPARDARDDDLLTLVAHASRVRQHKDVRLIVTGDGETHSGQHNEPLVALLVEARQAYDAMLAAPESTVTDIARRIGRCRKRLARLLRIAMLAPDIVTRCLDGTQPITLTTATLFSIELPLCWAEQRSLLGIA